MRKYFFMRQARIDWLARALSAASNIQAYAICAYLTAY